MFVLSYLGGFLKKKVRGRRREEEERGEDTSKTWNPDALIGVITIIIIKVDRLV